jgi:hypothetical protein
MPFACGIATSSSKDVGLVLQRLRHGLFAVTGLTDDHEIRFRIEKPPSASRNS